VQAAADAPHRAAPVANAAGHAQHEPKRERAAAPERIEVRRYADLQG
jgi:hypothetical protein